MLKKAIENSKLDKHTSNTSRRSDKTPSQESIPSSSKNILTNILTNEDKKQIQKAFHGKQADEDDRKPAAKTNISTKKPDPPGPKYTKDFEQKRNSDNNSRSSSNSR